MIAITGATGHLGQLTIAALLERGTPASEIVALVRDPAKASALAAKGVQIRQADYTQPDTLDAALQGIDKLLLISSNDVADRATPQRNVVDAAQAAGVKLLAYTSILRADTASMTMAADHKTTEEAIRESGIPFVFLRNSWYMENYNVAQAAQYGTLPGSAGDGRISAASRADYAAAAAAVLTLPDQENTIYELGGDTAFTLDELVAEIAAQSGRVVTYQNLPEGGYAEMLVGFGVPEPLALKLADADANAQHGGLHTDRRDLSRLIGRPTTTLKEAVTAGLAG
ncbi:SDR family oxidoreductase [Deinococcus marmoris]|uniref:NADPH:quinone oxidoreductase 2 n=1 Tax=Deinococcus marmoris TaxID=249408 RepID=A0A1U7P0M5_9DEIO|nr:SDR family oxidoreductase [Deinococcus marmoris]OLV18727.1 NADPH:quinone oxidoreductase 2 [Deinococcus marmoris]